MGGMLFGLGWALAGACPSIPLVQLVEGKVLALFTLAGIVAGVLVFRFVQRRYPRWDVGSCSV